MKSERTGIVITARVGSSRLYNKIGLDVNGVLLFDYFIQRIRSANITENIVVATTTESRDDYVVELTDKLGLAHFRGDEDNVLGRICACALEHDMEYVCRVTPDNIFTDITTLQNMLDAMIGEGYDYCYSDRLPIGLVSEVFTTSSLQKGLRLSGNNEFLLEHVTPVFRQHPAEFRVMDIPVRDGINRPGYRLTLDYQEDFEMLKILVDHFQDPTVDAEQIIMYLDDNPDVVKINEHIIHWRKRKNL